jgi:hypothetical protein
VDARLVADFVGEELLEPRPGVGIEHFLDSPWVNVLQTHAGNVGRRAEVSRVPRAAPKK